MKSKAKADGALRRKIHAQVCAALDDKLRANRERSARPAAPIVREAAIGAAARAADERARCLMHQEAAEAEELRRDCGDADEWDNPTWRWARRR